MIGDLAVSNGQIDSARAVISIGADQLAAVLPDVFQPAGSELFGHDA